MKEAATKEQADWDATYEKKIADKLAANQQAQDDFISMRDNSVPGSEWEKVAFFVDFKAKTTKDTSRMKSILLHLKQNGLRKD